MPLSPGTTWQEAVVQDCSASAFAGPFTAPPVGCTASSQFMIDIDANPGLIGALMTITLTGSSSIGGPVGPPVDALLSCTLAKKK